MANKEVITLIGGMDMIGFPATSSRLEKDLINYLDIIKKKLENEGYKVEVFDMHFLKTYNSTSSLNDFLENDVTLEEIKQKQLSSLMSYKGDFFLNHFMMPLYSHQYYEINEGDEKRYLLEELKKKNVIFCYYTGLTDFMKCIKNADGYHRFLIPNIKMETPNTLSEEMDLVAKKIEYNIRLLLEINPKMEIYQIGSTLPQNMSKIIKKYMQIIYTYNETTTAILHKFEKNLFYINNNEIKKEHFNNNNWRLSKKGHQFLADNIIQEMHANSKIVKFKK